ncbi:MAG: crotonase/enoyl-CoA hydratase family protein [Maricaulaceae bacterium]|jgi:enoyl-CoA hydratase
MEYRCFDVKLEGRVAHIVLNRPEKRNAMIPEFWDELPKIVQDLDENAKARAIVISSTGPHFCSGIDVSIFGANEQKQQSAERDDAKAGRTRGARFYSDVRRMQNTFSALENCRLPVLAAVQGGVIGGGVDLVTACDMRYATEDAFLTIFEINIGMTADVGTFPRLVKLIPEGIVRELAYTGRRMPAMEAQQVGLINRVYPDQATMLEGVFEIAEEIASKAPLAVYGSKRIINYARDHSTVDGLDYISIWNASMLQRDEIAEAMAANQDKRAGEFADLPKVRKNQSDEIS